MLIAAGGFVATAVLVSMLAREKEKLLAQGAEAQRTTLDHRLGGNPIDGFLLLLRSPYLLLLAAFLLLMTWISTIVYFQLGDLITKAFTDKAARTEAYATIDLTVNSLAVVVQLLGTGRIIKRFGVQTGLLLNPVIMVHRVPGRGILARAPDLWPASRWCAGWPNMPWPSPRARCCLRWSTRKASTRPRTSSTPWCIASAISVQRG